MKKKISRKLPPELAVYRRTGCIESRNRFLVRYIDLVCEIAKQIHKRLPKHVDIDSVVSDGFIGLLKAAELYDSTKASFSTYARVKIRNAIMDNLRSCNWMSRDLHRRNEHFTIVRERLFREIGFVPTEEELRRKLGVSKGLYKKIWENFLHPKINQIGDNFNIDICKPKTRAVSGKSWVESDPRHIVENKNLAEFIMQIVDDFDQRSLQVFKMTVLDGFDQEKIARQLDICVPTVRSYYRKAMRKIQSRLKLSEVRLG